MSTPFDTNATNACKGVALLLLLWHHLFYKYIKYGAVVHTSAQLAKVCVAIFVILSGYGIYQSTRVRSQGVLAFYVRRLSIIYSRYWLVALIFIPIGVVFMGRSVRGQFTSYPFLKLGIQLLGMHRFVYPEWGYNATWWYMSVIIPLVVLFPLISWLTEKAGLLFLALLFLILLPKGDVIPVLNPWLLPFGLGIYLSQHDLIFSVSRFLARFGVWRFGFLTIVLTLVAFVRDRNPLLPGIKLDWLFGLIIILLVFEITSAILLAQKIFCFLGTHLFNIFLFHTFIYLYYWHDAIYSFESPLLIFTALLMFCLAISIGIDFLAGGITSIGSALGKRVARRKSTLPELAVTRAKSP